MTASSATLRELAASTTGPRVLRRLAMAAGLTVGAFVAGAALLALAGGAASGPINIEQGKKWLAHSWLPILSTLPVLLSIADTYVASVAASDTVLVGHYQAAFSVAALAGYGVGASLPPTSFGAINATTSSTSRLSSSAASTVPPASTSTEIVCRIILEN